MAKTIDAIIACFFLRNDLKAKYNPEWANASSNTLKNFNVQMVLDEICLRVPVKKTKPGG